MLAGKGCRPFVGRCSPCLCTEPADPWKLGFSGRCSQNASGLTWSLWSQEVTLVGRNVASEIKCNSSSMGVNSCSWSNFQTRPRLLCCRHCGVSGPPGKGHSRFDPESSSGSLFRVFGLKDPVSPKAGASVLLPKCSSTGEAISQTVP